MKMKMKKYKNKNRNNKTNMRIIMKMKITIIIRKDKEQINKIYLIKMITLIKINKIILRNIIVIKKRASQTSKILIINIVKNKTKVENQVQI